MHKVIILNSIFDKLVIYFYYIFLKRHIKRKKASLKDANYFKTYYLCKLR